MPALQVIRLFSLINDRKKTLQEVRDAREKRRAQMKERERKVQERVRREEIRNANKEKRLAE